jgi:hypothetical protein
MWLITNFGFFSVIQREGDDFLNVRARSRHDLEELRKRYLPNMSEIIELDFTDYRFRATASHADVAEAFAKAIRDINYANFKNEVARSQGHKRAAIYHDVWSALYKIQKAEK